MRNLMMITALIATMMGYAQETKKTVVTKTKTTVQDNTGKDVTVKAVKKTTKRDVALTDFDGKHNFNTVMMPKKINTNVYYYYDNEPYKFYNENGNIYMIDKSSAKIARLYPTSQKGYYLVKEDDAERFGYFNQDGDFILEGYDADSDGIYNYIYKIDTMPKSDNKKDKM